MNVEVLLLQNISKLGDAGQVVKVADGYARNFLIPRKLAVHATQSVVRTAKELAVARNAEIQKAHAEFLVLRERLEALELSLPVKVGREDKLFGAVTNSDIAEGLKKLGVQIDRRKIEIKEPIKSLGAHQVMIKLDSQVEASLKVWVVRQ